MSDDEEIQKRETKESALDPEQLDELGTLPNFPDREEFVKTQEMDALNVRSFSSEDSEASSSLDSTQSYEIPPDLLQMAMRSQEMPVLQGLDEDSEDEEWREFVAIVDPRGRIVLPSRVQQELRGKKLRVKYLVDG